jgi:retinol dehydrogenase-12
MFSPLATFLLQALDPGYLKTDLYKTMPRYQFAPVNLILKDPIYGAYTELFAGLSSEIKPEMTGAWSK